MEKEKSYAVYLKRGCLAVLKVEVFFKLITFFVIGPLLDWVFTTWVLDDIPVFNEAMFLSILSPVSLVLAVIIFLAAALWCYYEISCLITAVYLSRMRERMSLGDILKSSKEAMEGMKHFSLPLSAISFVLFLPLVHAGYLNSLVPKVDIPRFVVGELQRTSMGNLGIWAIQAGYIVVFLVLLLVPFAMVLRRESFPKAVKQNFIWYRQISWKDRFLLWAIFIFWIYLENWILESLQGKLIQSQDFNLSVLKYFLRSHTYRVGLACWIVLALIQCVAIVLVFLWIIRLLDKYGELPYLSERAGGEKGLKKRLPAKAGKERCLARLCKKIWNSRSSKKIWAGMLLIAIAAAASDYFNEAPLMHEPWAIGHRGCIFEAENTIAAVERASGLGADYAEIDVQLSKDGVPMVIHDEDLQRLADMPEKVENLTADQLQELTVISNGEKGKIPTFQEMVEAVKNTKDKTGLLVELKPTAENRDELVSKVIETVEKCNAKNQCIFMSLDYESVYQLQAEHPEWWIGYCIYGGVGKMEDAVWEYNIDFLAVEEGLASNKFMEKARNSGLAVYIWTSNNFDDMENYLEMGASGIITDLPDLARDTIDRYMKDHQEYYAYDGKGYPKKKN